MENGRQGTGEGTQRGTPWGFYLVLAAIAVVAVMYSVTIYALGSANRLSPETVFGAMAASFTVIGTLVGTYFGIKAGLDGQDKVKESIGRATRANEDRPRGQAERNGDRRGERQPAGDGPGGSDEPRVRRRVEQGDRREWEEVGV